MINDVVLDRNHTKPGDKKYSMIMPVKKTTSSDFFRAEMLDKYIDHLWLNLVFNHHRLIEYY